MAQVSRPDILLAITRADLGGAQTHVRLIIDALHRKFAMHLLTGTDGPLVDAAERAGVPTTILPSLQRQAAPTRDLLALSDFAKALAHIRPRVLHAHSAKAGFFSRLAGPSLGIPTLYTAHGWGFAPGAPPLLRGVSALAEFSLAGRAQTTVVLTKADWVAARRFLRLPETKLALIPNAIPIPPSHPKPPFNSAPDRSRYRLNLVMTARFSQQKNQPQALRILAALPKGAAHLTLVGGGPKLNAVKAHAQALGLGPDDVTFLGETTAPEVPLAQADIFLHLSHYEGLPYALLEAMQAGKPCVASDIPGHEAVIKHGQTGFLAASECEARSHIRALLNSRELRIRIGAAARNHIMKAHALPKMSTPLAQLYSRTLQKRGETTPAIRNKTAHA